MQAPEKADVLVEAPWTPSTVARYLEHYGYFDLEMRARYRELGIPFPRGNPRQFERLEELSEALSLFQELMGLQRTGKFDEQTERLFSIPRCGNKDYQIFAREGFRWQANPLTIRFAVRAFLPNLNAREQRAAFEFAWGLWNAAGTPIRVIDGDSGEGIDVSVGDFGKTILGETWWQNYPIDVDFDTAVPWWFANPSAGYDLAFVAAHEFGHAIGLGHSRDPSAVMYAYYHPWQRTLAKDDIASLSEVYPSYGGYEWQGLNLWATSFAASRGGMVHAGHEGTIWRWNGSGWDAPYGGVALCVAIDPRGNPWHIGIGDADGNNNIYEWVTNHWEKRGGWAYDIAIGDGGQVFHVGRGGAIYRYDNGKWHNVPGADVHFEGTVGTGHKIAVLPNGECWHIGDGQQVFRPDGAGGWRGTNAYAYAVGAGPDGDIAHIGRGLAIYYWIGDRWDDGQQFLPCAAYSVEFGAARTLYTIGNGNGVWRRLYR